MSSVAEETPPITRTFSHQDLLVKVDSNSYQLNRMRWALKSNYLENLSNSAYIDEKNYHVLEIQPKNSDADVFPSVVEVINGKELLDVLNKDNYISLLKTMDHLEMEIDLRKVSSFMNDNFSSYSPEDVKIFELYNFIMENRKFEYLLQSVFQYLSNNLTTLQSHEIFSTIPAEHLALIIWNISKPNAQMKYEIIQICTKWICHDVKNRLPQIVKFVIAARSMFRSLRNENYPDLSSRVSISDIAEPPKQEWVARCLYEFLAYDGPIDRVPCYRGYDSDDYYGQTYEHYEYYEPAMDVEFKIYEQNPPCSVLNEIKENKLKRFFENGDFYNITVRVGEQTYKLHRSVLESGSDYFADIFKAEYAEAVAQCEGLPPFPSKDKEYVLEEVDQSTFDFVINYLYFGGSLYGLKSEITASVFKTAVILRIEKLLEHCIYSLEYYIRNISSEDSLKVLNCIYGKVEYNNLYFLYLGHHMRKKWPDIGNMSQFCSLSCDMLLNMLKLPYFYFDDEHKILDVCSKWVIHDVKNRYSLLPRIAQGINGNGSINPDDYKIETPEDLNSYSQQSIRDKLWEILCATSLVPVDTLSKNTTKKFEEIPMFVAWKRDRTLDILNGELDLIVSLSSTDTEPNDRRYFVRSMYPMVHLSTTMINDNLFIFCKDHNPMFQVYNISLRKNFSLDLQTGWKNWNDNLTLLNCRNEVYCCFERGLVLKYSIQLNRWSVLSEHNVERNENYWFTSDGEMLYRMYLKPLEKDSYSSCVFETYNFERHLWHSVPDLPSFDDFLPHPFQMTILNGHDIAVSMQYKDIFFFDRDSNKWRKIATPDYELGTRTTDSYPKFIQVAQYEDRLFYVFNNKLYYYSQLLQGERKWELKKKLPSEYFGDSLTRYPYNFSAIHRPNVCIN